jgi:hypothetical protein
MMIPRQDQIEMAIKAYHVLKEHMIVYLAAEERTGKTLAAILTAEMCQNVENILVITKKEPIKGWVKTLNEYPACKNFDVVTYQSAHKYISERTKYQLIILDESHNYISGYPKPKTLWKQIKQLCAFKPLIYISATPHPQGYQQLYHQFALSSWSPWKNHKNFYHWFNVFGIPEEIYVGGVMRTQYHNTNESLVKPSIEHLFIKKTRQELGFKFEPKDKVHYVELSESTKLMYNEMLKNLVYKKDGMKILCDTKSKLRFALHMLEGGVGKGIRDYYILENTEKIDYIKKTWGDYDGLVIFYEYKPEYEKLKAHFKHAEILQATSFAEGVELAHKDTLVVYSQNFSTAKFTQRRARQASMHRTSEIVVHYLVVADAVSEQAYEIVSLNKKNFVDSLFMRKELL